MLKMDERRKSRTLVSSKSKLWNCWWDLEEADAKGVSSRSRSWSRSWLSSTTEPPIREKRSGKRGRRQMRWVEISLTIPIWRSIPSPTSHTPATRTFPEISPFFHKSFFINIYYHSPFHKLATLKLNSLYVGQYIFLFFKHYPLNKKTTSRYTIYAHMSCHPHVLHIIILLNFLIITTPTFHVFLPNFLILILPI